MRGVGEKIFKRDLEKLGSTKKAPGAHAVGAFFVFLDLLEGDLKSIGEFGLGIAAVETGLPYLLTYMDVDGFWGGCHFKILLG